MTGGTPPTPVLGPRAKTALRQPVGGEKRRKLLTLIAAYADAGVNNPPWSAIGPRLKFLKWAPETRPTKHQRRVLKTLLDALEHDGWLTITQPTTIGERATYQLHLKE